MTRADYCWLREAPREIKNAGGLEGSFPDTMLDLKKQVGLAALCIGAGQDMAMFFGRFHCPKWLVLKGEVRSELF